MIDFLRYRKVCFAVSVILIVTGLAFFIGRGGFSYNIDFVGGTEIRIGFSSPFKASDLRAAVEKAEVKDFTVQNIQGDEEFIVRASSQSDLEEKLAQSLKSSFPDSSFTVRSVDHVGPESSKEVTRNALLAVLCVMLLLLLYITLRHRYAYAFGAVAALAHDLLVLLTVYLVFDLPISLNILTAVLTVLGYSLNDTIVVFNRIEDNNHHDKTETNYDVVNKSINQTLTRTLLTSLTTFISVFSLFIFGGDLFKPFALTMMIAVVVGTYSSVYIASPVMMFFSKDGEI